MKSIALTVLLAFLAAWALAELNPFVLDKEITKKEWKKIREKEELLRETIDFEALRQFLVGQSKERKEIVIGDESDSVVLDLDDNLPEEEWKLSYPRELLFTSGGWSWTYDEVVRASFYKDGVSLHWDIVVTERNVFKIKTETYENDRYSLY